MLVIPMNKTSTRRRSDAQGAALFIALALLSMFSLLGATYVRYMSIELDINARHLHGVRARQYAMAGIQSTMGYIYAGASQGRMPEPTATFSYGVYGQFPGAGDLRPVLMDAYSAEAQVTIHPLDAALWKERFSSGPPWPGEGRAFHVVSKGEVFRADSGRMRLVGKYAVESVLVLRSDHCEIITLGTLIE